jgi:hypothetical protein
MGVMAARLRRATFAGSNRPVCVGLGVADGREWISMLNTSIELSNWGLDSSLDGWYEQFKRRRFEDLKLPVKDRVQSQNGCFSRSPEIDR